MERGTDSMKAPVRWDLPWASAIVVRKEEGKEKEKREKEGESPLLSSLSICLWCFLCHPCDNQPHLGNFSDFQGVDYHGIITFSLL
jgi:hypothetical protein